MSAKILVVDDEVDTLKVMEITLRQEGYTVLKATNGEACLEIAATENPDLIILDNMMPNLSGLDVLKQLTMTYGHPPIILFSAKNRIEDVIEAMEAGAYRYLVKPTLRDKMLETVKAALEERQRQLNQFTTRKADDGLWR